VLPSVQKLALGLLATNTLKVVPFHVCAAFPLLLPFFKRILDGEFYENVQLHLRFCLDHLSCVKMAIGIFRDKAGERGGWKSTVMLFFVKNLLLKKEVRQYVVMM
jgi:hypothetical protein